MTVRGQDQYGAPSGNNGTANVTINIRDVNNHVPILEKEQVIHVLIGADRICLYTFFQMVLVHKSHMKVEEKQESVIDKNVVTFMLFHCSMREASRRTHEVWR